jgi:hypothetical protein
MGNGLHHKLIPAAKKSTRQKKAPPIGGAFSHQQGAAYIMPLIPSLADDSDQKRKKP